MFKVACSRFNDFGFHSCAFKKLVVRWVAPYQYSNKTLTGR